MQNYMFAAGVLAITVGLIHSILGEILIFNRMRNKGIIPTDGEPLLEERRVRILWASWHIVTILGWAIGAILLRFAFPISENLIQAYVENTIIISMLISALLVLVSTKGKHPGWLGLLGVAALIFIS